MRLKLTGNNSNYSSNAHLDGGIKCVTINRDPLGIGNDTGLFKLATHLVSSVSVELESEDRESSNSSIEGLDGTDRWISLI